MRLSMETTMSAKKVENAVVKILGTEDNKSTKMKELFRLGLEVKEIAKLMGVRYNFVYNVVSNMAHVEGLETITNKGEHTGSHSEFTKKQLVMDLLEEGKSVKEICIDLKMNANYVYRIKKEWVESIDKGTQTH